VTDRPGGIFVRAADQIPNEDRILLQAVARAILTDSRGMLWDQIHRRHLPEVRVPRSCRTITHRDEPLASAGLPRHDLIFFNGLGGFTPDGREYVISTAHGQVTPGPWVNVLANPYFGTFISEGGLACTWNEDAHEFRITPWYNDLVSDSSGEAFYLRDEESGNFWSPTPLPSRGPEPYVSRHGFGYSVFEHTEGGIRSEMWVYVAMDSTVKFTVLKVAKRVRSVPPAFRHGIRRMGAGRSAAKSALHVITEVDLVAGRSLRETHTTRSSPTGLLFSTWTMKLKP